MIGQPENLTSNPLRSVYTSNLAEILARLNLSLVISTYQAGKVILIRNDNGTVNTDFRHFSNPMAIAADETRLTIGGSDTIWYYHNMPDLVTKLGPAGKYDACYVPRRVQITGDVDIHEMAWSDNNELWIVNTRFSCLCTMGAGQGFHPHWQPHFISNLAPQDRCHLNGLAMVEGQPKYVTALGQSDTPGGWRKDKANGGILMDVDANTVLLRGLSMPHSPRWYRDQLWLLESGDGSLARADLQSGNRQTIARLPGFTRGMDFYGPLAFIGLSQVRDSAVLSGIPLVERLREQTCGVWVVNIETGHTEAFLRFEEHVKEIFGVKVLPNARFPEMLPVSNERTAPNVIAPEKVRVAIPRPLIFTI